MDWRPLFECTHAVGVDLTHGAVQRYRFQFDAHDLSPLQVFKHPVQHSILRPAVQPGVDGMPVAEAGRRPPLAAAILAAGIVLLISTSL